MHLLTSSLPQTSASDVTPAFLKHLPQQDGVGVAVADVVLDGIIIVSEKDEADAVLDGIITVSEKEEADAEVLPTSPEEETGNAELSDGTTEMLLLDGPTEMPLLDGAEQ